MEGLKKTCLLMFIAVFAVLCAAVTGMAREDVKSPDLSPVADVMMGSGSIHWQPKVTYARLTVSVATPGGQEIRKEFTGGSTPYLALSEMDDSLCIDGMYTYQLIATPYAEKRVRSAKNMAGLPGKSPGDMEPVTQTGYFRVRDGALVQPRAAEGIARTADEVIFDDLIVDGSLCVGNDCYSGYAFGFDTIVLMENNLRIFFDDTSNTSSFPNNDWRIVLNDTTDGGGAYFAVQDVSGGLTPFTLEAGAKTNSLYVDDDGQVGIGTSGPVFELHIKEGDSPTVRLHQDTSYGWPEQIWDVGGNETSFFIRDGTHAARLPFRIEPETPSSTLCLKSDGKVGLGTWSPAYKLEVETTGENAMFFLDRTDGAQFKLNASTAQGQIGTHSNHKLNIVTNNTNRITIEANGDVGIGQSSPSYLLHLGGGAYCDGGAWIPGSSREYKENISPVSLGDAMNALERLDPVKYNYKTNPAEDYLGFIAEDVPELVATRERKGINTMDVVAVLTKVVKEQNRLLKNQGETIDMLKEEINRLKEK